MGGQVVHNSNRKTHLTSRSGQDKLLTNICVPS